MWYVEDTTAKAVVSTYFHQLQTNRLFLIPTFYRTCIQVYNFLKITKTKRHQVKPSVAFILYFQHITICQSQYLSKTPCCLASCRGSFPQVSSPPYLNPSPKSIFYIPLRLFSLVCLKAPLF